MADELEEIKVKIDSAEKKNDPSIANNTATMSLQTDPISIDVNNSESGTGVTLESLSKVNQLSDSFKILTTVTEDPVIPLNNTPQIDADMMQIDSILKALNSGTFDQSNMMTIDHLTSQKPKNVLSAVQLVPSTGLSLIGQLSSDEDDDSSSSDSEDSECDSIINGETNNNINDECDSEEDTKKDLNTKKHDYPPMVKGEIDYRDLPIEEVINEVCPLSVELTDIGSVKSVTEKLIIIESSNAISPLDEGTMFWNVHRQSIGKLFETFGPVKNPFYSIRTEENSVHKEDRVFVALGDDNLTKFAFMQGIMKLKGCDASWRNDEEVPIELQEFSDDEKEKISKGPSRKQRHSVTGNTNRMVASQSNRRGSTPYQRHTPLGHASQMMTSQYNTPPMYPPNFLPNLHPPPPHYYPPSNVYHHGHHPPPHFFPQRPSPPSTPVQPSYNNNMNANDFVFPNNRNYYY